MVLSWLHEKALLPYFPNYVSPKTNKQKPTDCIFILFIASSIIAFLY